MARITLTTDQTRRHASTTPVVKPFVQPAFDPTKVAIKQSIEGSPRVDPFSEAMREAYDNDWSEAASRSALGRMGPDRNESDWESESARKNTLILPEGTSMRASGQETNEKPKQMAETGSLTGIGKPNKADVVEQATARADKKTDMTRHALLMQLSVTMDRAQTSTFVAGESAKKILSQRLHFLWSRDPLRAHNLRLAEMRAALSA